jgi:hypothetical protein
VQVPDWVRGEEHGKILTPRAQDIAVWALGGSVSTNGSITAQAIVVRTFAELEERKNEVSLKQRSHCHCHRHIELCNTNRQNYKATVADSA